VIVKRRYGQAATLRHKDHDGRDIDKASLAIPPRLGAFEDPDFLSAVHPKEPASRQWHARIELERHIIDVLEHVRQKEVLIGAHSVYSGFEYNCENALDRCLFVQNSVWECRPEAQT